MSSESGWKILSKETVYETKWISIIHHDVIAPTGVEAVYGMVHHKQYAIGIMPLDENGYTYLVGQDRFCFNKLTWEFPQGGGPFEETPVETAKRELAEECKLKAGQYIPLYEDLQISNTVSDETGFAYLATDLSPTTGELDDTEKITVRHVPLKEAFAMMERGEIQDSYSVCMLTRGYLLAGTGRLPESIARFFRDI